MKTRSRSSNHRLVLILSAALILPGCLEQTGPVPVSNQVGGGTSGKAAANSGGVTNETSSDAILDSFKALNSTKIIFNKSSFYNNTTPSSLNCAGDAHYYYDVLTDRRLPTKPSWLKNVAVELTNSNAYFGPSNATACSLYGGGASPASNCASFDDLQPLSGASTRSILVGGYGCQQGTVACNPFYTLSDIWNLSMPDKATGHTWIPQNGTLPTNMSATPSAAGLVFASGGYDELHDEFYIYGGSIPESTETDSSLAAGTRKLSNKLIKVSFNVDGTVNTSTPPATVDASSQQYYAGWRTQNIYDSIGGGSALVKPLAMAGHSFTYASRRDPTSKSQCVLGDAINEIDCRSGKYTNSGTTKYVIAQNEHDDYYLLLGGLNNLAPEQINKKIYLYKPHGVSNDVGTIFDHVPANGDWHLLSNETAGALGSSSNKIMSIVDLAPSDASTYPVQITRVLHTRSNTAGADVFSGWAGVAYHRTVYDPTMNRFYIYGGIQSQGAFTAFPTSPRTSAPDIVSSEIWVYDPPALGRRPTAGCYTTETPEGFSLPASTVLTDATVNLGANRSYTASQFVFPPGGCLQRIRPSHLSSSVIPGKRFEQAMTFDRDQKAVVIFGGCNQTAVIPANLTSKAGDPLANCAANSLLNDTWVYLPPTTTEVVPNTYTNLDGGVANPYHPSYAIPNIFGTNFSVNVFPYYSSDNSPSSANAITTPTIDDLLGTWVKMAISSTAVKPTPRASANFVYDRAHHKMYLQGGYGCSDSNCSSGTAKALNDLWEYTPPSFSTECTRSQGVGSCTNYGSWKLLRANLDASNNSQPTQRYGALMDLGQPMFSHADDFYTVTDTACVGQGPIATGDVSVNRKYVGAVYIDIDRTQFSSRENLLINLKLLAFDKNTKLPGYFDNNTPNLTLDDADSSSTNDQAVLRVQLMTNFIKYADSIMSIPQPRFHEYLSGSNMVGDTFLYIGATGQITEKQIHVPLSIDPSINMIKIERVQGTVKFYEMSVSKF